MSGSKVWLSATGRSGAAPLLRLGAAGALGGALWVRGPLGQEDVFASTVAVLPFVVVAWFEIARQAQARGGRAIHRATRWLLGLGLVLWCLLVSGREQLALASTDAPLAAALALLLILALGAQVVALRPLLGRRLPARPSWLFLALPFVVYLALLPWSARQRPVDGDEPWYLLVTHSLAYDFDANLTNNYRNGDWKGFIGRPLEPQPGDPTGPQGELYSRHNALLPLLLAPAYRVAGLAGALATMAFLTAALAWMTLRLARHYFPNQPGAALLAYALVAFAPPLLLYSYQLWVEVPAALIAMVAFDAFLSGRRRYGEPVPADEARRWLVIALCLVLLPLLKIRFMLLAAPLLALAWWHCGRPLRPALAVGALLTVVGAGILLHNHWLYDNPLKIHSWEEVELGRYGFEKYWLGASGLFWDGAFGLFACAPLWLLLLPAVVELVRRRHGLLVDTLVFVAPYMLIVVPRAEWYGGWSPPFRYALVALPLLGLMLVPVLAERRRFVARGLLAALGAATLALTLLWVAEPGWTYNFADGRTYLLDHWSARVGGDVARLFPSSVRDRTATWVWPVITVLGIPLLWRLSFRPRRFGWGTAPALAGLAALLLLLTVVPVAARRLPSQVIELEDPYVVKPAGRLFPDRWVIERTRYRGGWILAEGEALTAPVVAGGSRAELVLHAELLRRHPGPLLIEVEVAGVKLPPARLLRHQQWMRLELGAVDWPVGAEVVVRALPSALDASASPPNEAVLDRLEIHWR